MLSMLVNGHPECKSMVRVDVNADVDEVYPMCKILLATLTLP